MTPSISNSQTQSAPPVHPQAGSQQAEQLKQQLLAFEAPYVEEKLLQKGQFATRDECRRALVELMKYLWLSFVFDQRFSMVSKRVDNVWHQFILFTREYHAFCQQHFGSYMHHAPHVGPRREPDEAFRAGVRGFFAEYQTHFGPVSRLWADWLDVDVAELSDSLARTACPEFDFHL